MNKRTNKQKKNTINNSNNKQACDKLMNDIKFCQVIEIMKVEEKEQWTLFFKKFSVGIKHFIYFELQQ